MQKFNYVEVKVFPVIGFEKVPAPAPLSDDVRQQIKLALDEEVREAGPQEDYSDPLLNERK